jgi:hypothetical protein
MTDQQIKEQLDVLRRGSEYLSNSPKEVVLKFFADAGILVQDIKKDKKSGRNV